MHYFVCFSFCYGNAMYSCWDRLPPHYCFFCFWTTVCPRSIFVVSEFRFLLFDNFMFSVWSHVSTRWSVVSLFALWFRSPSIVFIVIFVCSLLFVRFVIAIAAFKHITKKKLQSEHKVTKNGTLSPEFLCCRVPWGKEVLRANYYI